MIAIEIFYTQIYRTRKDIHQVNMYVFFLQGTRFQSVALRIIQSATHSITCIVLVHNIRIQYMKRL